MIKERYTIVATSPNGKQMESVERTIQSIRKIKNAMEANNYTNIKIFKKAGPSPHVLFTKGLQNKFKCSPKIAVDIYRKMIHIMEEQGIEFTRKEVSINV
jgi:hypothetical protein